MAVAKLSPKQARFVQEYLVDLNATQAAIRAGYSERTAKQIAGENLTKPDVMAALALRQKVLQAKVEVTQERVLRELIRIGFSDLRKVATWGADGMTLIESDALDNDTAMAIQEVACIKRTRRYDNDDDDPIIQEEVQTKAKLYNKLDALEKLGKHLGLFREERGQLDEAFVLGFIAVVQRHIGAESAARQAIAAYLEPYLGADDSQELLRGDDGSYSAVSA